MVPPWTSRGPAGRAAAASAGACLLAALLATLLVTARLRFLLGEQAALIAAREEACKAEQRRIIEESGAQLARQRAIIEALQAKEASCLVRCGALQGATAHLALRPQEEDRRSGAQGARRSTAQPPDEALRFPASAFTSGPTHDAAEDAPADLAALRRRKEDRRRARDARRSTAQPYEDERRVARGRPPLGAPRESRVVDARRFAEQAKPRGRRPRRPPPPTSPGRPKTEVRRLAAEAGQLCTNYPLGWVDANGDDCHTYVQGGLCTPTGGYGDGWAELGYDGLTFDDLAASDGAASSACCGCGGGNSCTDAAGWKDKNGNTCAAYASKGYCDGDGGTGAGWPPAWGTFANQTLVGKATAATACCACRPRPRDASGRGCDYYALHPAQCGCCDDEDFQAQLTCSNACSTTSAQQDLTRRLAEWTNDTRMIIFPAYGISGTVPADWSKRFPLLQIVELTGNYLTGTLPSELGLLPELRTLQLGTNAIWGSIPAKLNLLHNLQYLDIENNYLTGAVPPQLGLLSNLRVLSLQTNLLSGTLPAELGQLSLLKKLQLYSNKIEGTVIPELGQLANLEILYLHDNQLTGTIPPELGNLRNLTELWISGNLMEGTAAPELGQLANLEILCLDDNQLRGSIPPEMGKLHNLVELWMSYNKMDGTMVPELGQLANLEILCLNDNKLTGSIPTELGNLHNLKEMWIADNMLDGPVPFELGRLSNLRKLSLHHNSFTGTVSRELGQLANLETLYLHNNQLTGTMPPDLGNLHNLKELWASNNMMDGPLPAELAQLSSLWKLQLHGNRFTGTVAPELGQLAGVEILYLHDNQLTGPVPPELGRLSNLRELSLHNNSFNGTVAPELGQLANLEVLYLYENQLTGTTPPELGNLRNLTELLIYNNMMDGPVPAELGQLSNLRQLDLHSNRFTGTVAPELGELVNLEILYLNNNQLSGTIPPELGRLHNLKELYVSSNMMDGTIPGDIGNLTSLKELALNSNMLEGMLPSTLGNLVQLELLMLWNNRLHGSLPAEMGALAMLTSVDLSNNELSGTLPGEAVGNWRRLQRLHIGSNRFTGPVPHQLGLLQQVSYLQLSDNLFTSLPAEVGKMQALQVLYVQNNTYMTGAFPDTSVCLNLKAISAQFCNFTTAGAVGPAVSMLLFKGNAFASLPDSWASLPAVSELDLSYNYIGTWRPFGVLPLGTFYVVINSTPGYTCGRFPLQPRLNWTEMEKVDLSGNPLGDSITVRDFIWSFAYLRRLTDLRAASCGLRGDVPMETGALAWDVPNTGDFDCNNTPTVLLGYPALFVLDLSDNDITSIRPPPTLRLSQAILSSNALSGAALHPLWYAILGNLDVWGNPFLRSSVEPPKGDRGGCPSAGTGWLQADGLGWTEYSSGDAFQCTSLCAGARTRYKTDPWLNVSSLCRCKAGRQGAATNCSACPANTFSDVEDHWGMVRTCRACPPLSGTDDGVENATTVDQCRCPSGWYMGTVPVESNITQKGNETGDDPTTLTTPACVQCRQGQFQTTPRGAKKESECVCNPDYEGLRALRGSCGCMDGMYMDHVAKRCRPCASSVEKCTWGASVELSLSPPVVRQGYWAEPWADSAVGNFSKNDIWRCVSKDTCQEGSVCADGRQGRSCSLCAAGMYGGPDGGCRQCSRTPAESRQALPLLLLAGLFATVAAHLLLQGTGNRLELATSLQSVRTSAKQLLKYLQMLGVLSVFNVHWPSAARSFLTNINQIVVALPELAGVACLTGQQTASLEMGFRWLLPAAGLASACLTALLLVPICWLCRRMESAGRSSAWGTGLRACGLQAHRVSRWLAYMEMDRWDVLRVCLWGLVLFQSTVLQFGTQILTCVPSPNGVATVLTFPHLACNGGEEEWSRLAGASCAFLATFVLVVLAAVYTAWRRAVHALVESNFKSRGWWGFLFIDFRLGSTQWVMLVMAKDICLVVIATAGAGDGPSQLLATAVGATVYSYFVLRDQPFHDQSNNVLEAWTAMSLASLSVFSAGMGYQASPGETDDADLLGVDDALYKSRARAMTALMWLTLVGPAVAIVYQIVSLSEKAKRRLPLFLRPMTEEERTVWYDEFLASLGIIEEAAEFRGVVESFDDIDGWQFRSLMGTSMATLGIVPTHCTSSIRAAPRRRMEDLVRRSESFLPPARMSSSARSDGMEAHLSSSTRTPLSSISRSDEVPVSASTRTPLSSSTRTPLSSSSGSDEARLSLRSRSDRVQARLLRSRTEARLSPHSRSPRVQARLSPRSSPRSKTDEARFSPSSRIDEARLSPRSSPRSKSDEARLSPRSSPRSRIDEARFSLRSQSDEARFSPWSRSDEARSSPRFLIDEDEEDPGADAAGGGKARDGGEAGLAASPLSDSPPRSEPDAFFLGKDADLGTPEPEPDARVAQPTKKDAIQERGDGVVLL